MIFRIVGWRVCWIEMRDSGGGEVFGVWFGIRYVIGVI